MYIYIGFCLEFHEQLNIFTTKIYLPNPGGPHILLVYIPPLLSVILAISSHHTSLCSDTLSSSSHSQLILHPFQLSLLYSIYCVHYLQCFSIYMVPYPIHSSLIFYFPWKHHVRCRIVGIGDRY